MRGLEQSSANLLRSGSKIDLRPFRACHPSRLLLMLLCTLSARAIETLPNRPSLPRLSRAEQVLRLTPDQSRLGYPVRLRAVVTAYDPEWNVFFVEDSTGGIYLDPRVPRSFKIRLRSPGEIALLERPSWWTPRHTLWSLGMLTVAILAALAWGATLRRRVEKQTGVILERLHRIAALEERYRELFENANDMVFTCGLGGQLTSLNKAGERITGYAREEVLGRNIAEIVTPECSAFAQQMTRQEVAQLGPRTHELEIVTKDGRRVPLEISAAFIYSEELPVEMQGIARDITQRKFAETALRESETRFRQLVENIHEVFWIAGGDLTQLLYVSPAYEEIWGRTTKSLYRDPKSFLDAVHPEDRAWVLKSLERLRHQGRLEGEFRIVRPDGSVHWVRSRSFPVRDHTGQTYRYVGIAEDITARKHAEEAMRSAQQAAEAANRLKSEFLANMSHEIRTPLNGILGMTELALDTELTPEQGEYLGMVKSSADTLLMLVNDILDFSKIEAGKLDLDQTDFSLRDSLGETMKTLALRAHQKGLELLFGVPHEVPDRVRGDPTRLRQIIVNLVGNAVKFTEQGEVALRVETESKTEDEVLLRFAVTDTGIGIAREKQQAIFEAFVQADGSTTRKHGGSGLGLAISSQLVAMMGGRIWVESEVGRGSTFYFTARFGLPKGAPVRAVPNEAASLRDLPVLVVDDNATNRRILEEILLQWRMKPALAEGGWTALAALERACDLGRPFPLVLIDAQMPDMDGFALVERIKSDPRLAGATIMMLTSAGQRGDAARCRALGIVAYLIKPIKQSDLLEAILLALGQKPRPSDLPSLITRHSLREARRKLRVLLAEDNAVNQELAVRLLERRGHSVVLARNGKEALAALDEQKFDLVLMDVQMPEMDGFEATAAIRAREKQTRQHLPIIAMTAHVMKGDRERCLAAGMDGYIPKPVQPKELFQAIEGLATLPAEAEGSTSLQESPDEVLDRVAVLARVDGDSELLEEMVKLFLRECPNLLAETRQAVRRRDAGALERAAHTLKSAMGNFGRRAAYRAADRLEQMGREGELDHAEEAFQALEREIERLKPALVGLAQEVGE